MKKYWQNWVNVFLGVWVFVSPWFMQQIMAPEGARGAGTWNLYVVGVAIAVLSLVALYAFNAWEEWLNVALGVWLLVSPWLMGYSASTALRWNAVVAGVLVVVFAAWALYEEQRPKQVAG